MAHRFELIANEIAWSYKHAIKGINLVWGFSASVNNITYFCRVCKSLFAYRRKCIEAKLYFRLHIHQPIKNRFISF